MRKLVQRFEYGFTVFAFLMYTDALLLLILSGGANQEDVEADYNTSLYKLCYIVIYLITWVLLLPRWKQALRTLTHEPFVFALLGLVAISTLWSYDPGTTLKDSITLIGSSSFAVYVATRYRLQEQLQILGWTFGIAILLSIVFAVALPKYGQMGGIHAGAWRGIYLHKNGLGAKMVTSLFIFLLLSFQTQRKRWIPVCGILLSIVLIVMSRSTSSLLNAGFITIAIAILQTVRWRYHTMVLAIMSILVIAEGSTFWLLTNAESMATSLGKDLTLSGRTILWAAVWDMIQKHPWLGYGYGGFWQGMNGPSSYIWLSTGWKMTHPHNGFLALWLDLGILGLSLFVISFFRNFYRSITLIRLNRSAYVFLPVGHFIFLILSNLTESSLLYSNFFPWISYIALSLSVTSELNATKSALWRQRMAQDAGITTAKQGHELPGSANPIER